MLVIAVARHLADSGSTTVLNLCESKLYMLVMTVACYLADSGGSTVPN